MVANVYYDGRYPLQDPAYMHAAMMVLTPYVVNYAPFTAHIDRVVQSATDCGNNTPIVCDNTY